MDKTLKYHILLLEDNEQDAFLLKRQLQKQLPEAELHVAATQEAYEKLVRTLNPDLILSDYRLPRYSGIEAMLYARAHSPVVPFVFVTGALHNEELAADTILQGANGFVLKNNLDKLGRILPELLQGQKRDGIPVIEEPVAISSNHAEPLVKPLQDHGADHQAELLAFLAQADAQKLARIRAILEDRE